MFENDLLGCLCQYHQLHTCQFDIYPKELVVSETSESRYVVSYLDLLIDMSNGDLGYSLFYKRDAFDFDIVNFPDLRGSIPTAPDDGTYISQQIRYSRACHYYDNFSSRHSMLAERRFNQGFSARKLMRTFYKFISRYPELASKFNKSLSSMICDSVPMVQLYHTFPQLMK